MKIECKFIEHTYMRLEKHNCFDRTDFLEYIREENISNKSFEKFVRNSLELFCGIESDF